MSFQPNATAGAGPSVRAFRVYTSTTQGPPTPSTWTGLTFNNTDYNIGGWTFASAGLGLGAATVPESGIYQIIAYANNSGTGTQQWFITIGFGGAAPSAWDPQHGQSMSSALTPRMTVSSILKVSAGATITLGVFSDASVSYSAASLSAILLERS